jgi:hypothetical protein
MVYRGQVKGGVVVFDTLSPPEGTAVQVQPLPSEQQAVKESPTIWKKLQKYAGTVLDLPADMALNHDHYIHGGPKK